MSFNNLSIAINYLKSIEEGKTGEALDEFYDEEAVQIEYPNSLTKNLTTRNLAALKDGSIKGQKILKKQKFEIVKSYTHENIVILEMIWTAVLAIPIGKIAAGGEMKAYFAQFIEFKNGKIIRQRTYDCFEPFM